MSTSKWVNRNIRSGHLPRPVPATSPAYRKDYVRKKSSRSFRMRDRRVGHRQRRAAANRLFAVAVVVICAASLVAAAVYSRKHHRRTSSNPAWQQSSSRIFAPDTSPDPIPHDPTEIVDRFLRASTQQTLSAICREDDNSQTLLSSHSDSILDWLDQHRGWMPAHEAKANGVIFSTFTVRHLTEPARVIYIVQTPSGPKVDVGAFLTWSSERWSDLCIGHTTRATILRAIASRSEYYNYRFQDDQQWQCYRLETLGEDQPLYGYALRGSNTNKALEGLTEADQAFPVIVSLEDGERGSSHRQFRIARALAAGWAMGPEILEDHVSSLGDSPPSLSPNPRTPSAFPSPEETKK